MFRSATIFALVLFPSLLYSNHLVRAEAYNSEGRKLFNEVGPAVVAVRYLLQTDLGRDDRVFSGVIVSTDGLVMVPISAVSDRFPDDQMKDFKIQIPQESGKPLELDAVFQGRDPRYDVAFIKTREPQKLVAIKFEDVPVAIGDIVYSIGMMPTKAGACRYLMSAMVSTNVPGEIDNILVDGRGLATVGSPVFNAEGRAIGFVTEQPPYPLFLNDTNSMDALFSPPKFYTPTAAFSQALREPPTPGHPIRVPWIGLPELSGLSEDESNSIGLGKIRGIRVGDIIEGTPAQEAGLKQGDIIVGFNGKSLDAGMPADDLARWFYHQIITQDGDAKLTLSIRRPNSKMDEDIAVKLRDQPEGPSSAKRYWSDAFGFGARDLVLLDRYVLKVKPDQQGVVITSVKTNSQTGTALLRTGDVLMSVNGHPVKGVADFQATCEDLSKSHAQTAVSLDLLRRGQEIKLHLNPWA